MSLTSKCLCRDAREFLDWSRGLAQAYGYNVHVESVGHCVDELHALAVLPASCSSPGAATQVACLPCPPDWLPIVLLYPAQHVLHKSIQCLCDNLSAYD